MAGLSSPGIGSGLDVSGLVSKLMEVEKQPLANLDKKEVAYQAKLTAFGTLKGALSALQNSVRNLNSPSKFGTMKATVGDTTIATATTSSIAKAGTYSLEVTTLAQAQKLSSAAIADPTASVGTGTLTIDFGTYVNGAPGTFTPNASKTAKTITIDSTNSSLNGIRDAVNAANAGVTANIVNDGSGYRLVFSGNDAGVDNSIRIAVNEGGLPADNVDTTGLSKLAFDPTLDVGAGENLEVKVAAQSASFKLDGIVITKSTNTVTDAIQGVTLNLVKTNAGSTTTLTVARDTADVKASVESFVKSYNDLAKVFKELGGYDAATKKGGVLLGDSSLRTIQDQLRKTIGQTLGTQGSAGLNSLSDLGISFQRDGTLAINSSKFSSVLADSTKNVGMLFATLGSASDSLVRYVGSSTATQTGTHSVDISTVPARGYAQGTQAAGVAGVITIDSSNRTLMLTVDTYAASVTLNEGTYSYDSIVAELQARINSDTGLSANGKKVTVSHNSGTLSITSDTYGSASTVAVTGGTSIAHLFGSTAATAGADVAGTIGGVPGTGSGQTLTGDGIASGLKIDVDGGVTGARGTVSFSRGIAYKLDTLLQDMLDSDGTVTSRTDGIARSVKDIARQRTVLQTRLVQTEKRYRDQFNALDSLVASMQQTSSYLQQQLASISAQTNSQ